MPRSRRRNGFFARSEAWAAIPAVVMVIALALAVAAGITAQQHATYRHKLVAAGHSTMARVTGISTSPIPGSADHHVTGVELEYSVGGRIYRTELAAYGTVINGDVAISHNGINGRALEIYYDAASPQRAQLRDGYQSDVSGLVTEAVAAAVAALLAAVATWRLARR